MAEFQLPFHIIPPDATPEEAEAWRQMMRWMAQQAKTVKDEILADSRFDNERIARGLHSMQNDVTLDTATRPNAGYVLYAIDGYKAAWGAAGVPSPTDPGTGPSVGATDHGALTGLADDDHLQYFLLAGRASTGGQIGYGGTASGDDLEFYSTSHATKGWIKVGSLFIIGTDGRVGINKTVPTALLDIVSTATTDVAFRLKRFSAAHYANILEVLDEGNFPTIRVDIDAGNYTNLRIGGSSKAGAIGIADPLGLGYGFFFCPTLSADRSYTYPDDDGEVLLDLAIQTVGNKTLSTTNILKSNTIASGVSFSDNTTATKRLRMILSGAVGNNAFTIVSTAARTYTFPNVTGQVAIVGDDPPAVAAGALGKVDSTISPSAAVASTNLTNGGLAGMYLVAYTLLVTTADVTAGSIQLQVNHTDDLGATTQLSGAAVLPLTATGRHRGEFTCQLASGELSYQTNLTGIGGVSVYKLFVRVIALG